MHSALSEKMMENNFRIKSGAVSDRGLSDKRPQNEDSFIEIPQLGLFAVADGVGGANAGEVASQMAVEILSEAFSSLRSGGDAEDRMRAAIQQANTAIFQMSSDIPQLSTMATTVVALHIHDNIATIGHVGDSRLYRVDEKGNLYRETRDHSVVEEEVRAGRLTAEQAEQHPSRNLISRALGADGSVEVDLKTIMFTPGTSFLLCSDGITRHITDLEISQLLMSPLEPDEICHTMKSLCYERGAEDNLTAVVIRCGSKASAMPIEDDILDLGEPTVVTPRAAEIVMSEPAPLFEPEQPKEAAFEPVSTPLSYSLEEQDEQLAKMGIDPEWGSEHQVPAPAVPVSEPPKQRQAADDLDLLVYQGDGGSEGGSGNFLGYAGMIIIGLILGFGGAVLVGLDTVKQYIGLAPATAVVENVPLTQMQTPNIAYTAFEDARRRVDENPQGYITNLAGRADGAEDNYLLARAFAHVNKPDEAKIALETAKKQLGDSPSEDKQMLATEIALLHAALANLGAFQQTLPTLIQSTKAPAPPAAPAANANVNVNGNVKPGKVTSNK